MSIPATQAAEFAAVVFGLAALLVSFQLVAMFPLTIVYEFWKSRSLCRLARNPFQGLVSVLVPAFNEEKTVRLCVESILASSYSNLEVIVINDGSTDSTERSIESLAESGRVKYLVQPNRGKAAALNHGISVARGEIIVFTDADSLFLPGTVGQMARWFADSAIDAVCGNDTPLRAHTILQRVMAVTTHIGTGFVRRALSVAGVLPIITGNLGAVRADTIREAGGFRRVWGEDLELTFRLQGKHRRIVFDPDPIVRAECPGSLGPLWRQRVRWVRSYLKVTGIHRTLLWPPHAFPFSAYLPLNFFTQVVVPVLQLLSLPILAKLAMKNSHAFHQGGSCCFMSALPLLFSSRSTVSCLTATGERYGMCRWPLW